MKAVVAAFNQEKALVGAFSVIVKTDCGTDGSFYSTTRGALHLPADAALRPRLDLLDLLLPPPAAAVHQGSFR